MLGFCARIYQHLVSAKIYQILKPHRINVRWGFFTSFIRSSFFFGKYGFRKPAIVVSRPVGSCTRFRFFGCKYSFMVYNVAAKMTIFKNLGVIEAGIEIVPVKELALQMSSGVSYFEQFTWDLEKRGVSNIDTPVLILGIL